MSEFLMGLFLGMVIGLGIAVVIVWYIVIHPLDGEVKHE